MKIIETGNYANRKYGLYAPSKSPDAIVMFLHGANKGARKMIKQTKFKKFADKNNWLVVYPQADVQHHKRFKIKTWNDGRNSYDNAISKVNDVNYLTGLISKLQAQYGFRKVYVAGVSNGGIMAHHLACSTNIVDKVAMIAAAVPAGYECNNQVPTLFIRGINDPLFPLNGGESKTHWIIRDKVLGIQDTVEYFDNLDFRFVKGKHNWLRSSKVVAEFFKK